MKYFKCLALVVSLALSVSTVFADRNEDRIQNTGSAASDKNVGIKELKSDFSSKLSGYLVLKSDSNIIYEDGKAKSVDNVTISANNAIYVQATEFAGFFGQKAIWDENEKVVKINDNLIYPSDYSKIINGKTYSDISQLSNIIGSKIIYNDNDTAIVGNSELDEATILGVVNELRDKFYVDVNAKEPGNGTKESPFKSIDEAKLYLREYTLNGMSSNITVYLRGGLYTNYDTIVFSPEDSGKNGYTITYRSFPGEQAEIVSAKTITSWKPYKNGIYMAKIDSKQAVNTLFENDLFANKARYPNLGDGAFRDYYLKSAGYISDKKFNFNKNDFPYLKDSEGLQVALFGGGENGDINWWMETYNARVDYREKSLTLSMAPAKVMGKGSRYYIQGALELLDAKGEYYFDSNNKIVYYMPYNEDINSQIITYGTTENPIILQGTESKNVKNLNFVDLKIGKSNAPTEQRAGTNQAICFNYADNCSVKDCEILLTGNDSISFFDCKNCTVSGNYIHDVGANAVRIDADFLYGEVKFTNNKIDNNYIKNVGLLKREASGIYIKNTDYGTVMYNHIEGVPRMAIQFGTGYQSCSFIGQSFRGRVVDVDNQFEFVNCIGNNISFNDVTDVMTDSQDGGAIYCWASGKDNLVLNNHIYDTDMHKISEYPAYFPLYNDDSSGYTNFSYNIVDNNQHFGKGQLISPIFIKAVGNTVQNNFLLNNQNVLRSAISTHGDIEDPGNNNICINNLVMNSGDNLHGQYSWKSDRFKLCNFNMYYNDNNKYLIYGVNAAKNFEQWQNMITDYGFLDRQSICNENPNFVDYSNRDYRLRYDSDAYSLGIKDINERDIGVLEDFKYANAEENIKKLYPETDTDGLSANVRISKGQTSKILLKARTVSGFFANLDNADIKYESSDSNIASVSDNGEISGVNDGVCEVTITVLKNDIETKTCLYVLVEDNVNEIVATSTGNIVLKGEDSGIISYGKTSMGYAVPIDKLSYLSQNENVAAVDDEGNIHTKNSGETDIVVSGNVGGVNKESKVHIKVLDSLINTVNLFAEKTDAIGIGEKVQFGYSGNMTDGAVIDKNSVKVTYSTDDASVVTVDENGTLTGVGEGRANVNVFVEKDGFGRGASVPVSVFENYSGKLAQGYKEINFGTSHGYADFREDGSILLRSTGDDYYGEADDGYYLYKDIKGDKVTIEMTINSLLETSNNVAVGLTVRESATAESKNYTIRALASGKVISVWRSDNGSLCSYADHGSGKFPVKLKIEKNGSEIKSYIDNGSGYKQAYSINMKFNSDFTVGIPMFSQSTLSTEAIVSDLQIVSE